MKIQSFFQISLNPDQQNTIEKLEEFLDSGDRVFLLKGYAGTGKTTLIAGLIKALEHEKKQFVVCAPTGRAAKVLRNKTGHGATIHSTIYDFDNLETKNSNKEDVAEHSYEYFFPILKLESETIVIVDEASMISSRQSKHELFTFGTDVLLSDLLTYTNFTSSNCKNKMIVIGDPAQLAPVGDNNSWALEKSFYEKRNISVIEAFLSEVMRQKDNLILDNAFKIRNCIEETSQNKLKFNFDTETFINFNSQDVVAKYCELFPKPDFNGGVIITYSNAQNLHYNQEIRKNLFPSASSITEGDFVQIINNSYHKYETKIYNGDFAQIIRVGEKVTQSAPVMVTEGGKKIRKIIHLNFRKITLRLADFDGEIDAYINETLLESIKSDLDIDEMKALYINTIMRFKELNPKGLVNSELFRNFLKNDDFFNSLRIKYGYSITGHKSQGGEWKTIFVDYYGRVSLKKDPLRWSYTATTRASECLYAVNFPQFSQYFKLKFSTIGSIGSVPKDSFSFQNVPLSPFHNKNSHQCKSWLYWNLLNKCEISSLKIIDVISEDWLEKYTFEYGEEILKAEIYHNAAGYFKNGFNISQISSSLNREEILEVLNGKNEVLFSNSYKASEDFLIDLYNIVQAASNDAEVRITNVVEQKENYFVCYYFETDNPISFIQFYFKKGTELSSAIVKTYGDTDDNKLNSLISKITDYATISKN